ncbi:hypothetical protein BDV25DRAFT_167683 [Aspergillus avenaceus]|uniref:Uncharacterized protein n=1 Tax=Aspergillus avenaceus TaxID=36643 RepID=A0A5N6TCH4_ASPAV|nr:hypothetical protein BDV25DRAFT_167683 [Aspergillus avenaceus]
MLYFPSLSFPLIPFQWIFSIESFPFFLFFLFSLLLSLIISVTSRFPLRSLVCNWGLILIIFFI